MTGKAYPERNKQFEYIEEMREFFYWAGVPGISIDTKKKELIGNFKNEGRIWCKEAEEVNVHDFKSDAEYLAVPYGIHDYDMNEGFVYVGTSVDTSEFAVDAIEYWWRNIGRKKYPDNDQLFILADAGGSNSYRNWLFKQQIQEKLANKLGLSVIVSHYPPGASKWNPVEHKLFGPISINWAGKPLRSIDTMLNCIRGTTNISDLKVKATVSYKKYKKGIKISKKEIEKINILRHDICPNLNYTIFPNNLQ